MGNNIIQFSGSRFKTVRSIEYLTLYLNSTAGKTQVEQVNTGGIQTNLTIPVIEDLQIVCPPFEIQNQIVKIIQTAFSLRQQSEKLLEIAKRAVEIAIEENEETASSFLKNDINMEKM